MDGILNWGMPYTIEYDGELKYLHCTLSGTIDPQLIEKFAVSLVSMQNETGCLQILNDLTEAEIDLSVTDIKSIPALLSDMQLPQDAKRALVFSSRHRDLITFEDVSREYGQTVRVFTTIRQAIEWLTT